MHQIITFYNHPQDRVAFDKYFEDVHLPMAKDMPGQLRKTICRPAADLQGNPPPYYLIVVIDFADEEAVDTALASEAGKLAAADLDNFAQAGRTTLIGPVDPA